MSLGTFYLHPKWPVRARRTTGPCGLLPISADELATISSCTPRIFQNSIGSLRVIRASSCMRNMLLNADHGQARARKTRRSRRILSIGLLVASICFGHAGYAHRPSPSLGFSWNQLHSFSRQGDLLRLEIASSDFHSMTAILAAVARRMRSDWTWARSTQQILHSATSVSALSPVAEVQAW